ncbi:testin [Trichomycterus rosablanca]|uniref:testin n=1 Tax=Trichomycterus rosablanca TaxID=2290929 RepID=UPI002F35C8AB
MEIEKEVKKMTLGHEIGAGAACLKCKDKCEGFELHFWRKICRNCKCGIEDHDVLLESEENQKVGRLFEDTKYTGLIAKLKKDGLPMYRGNQMTVTISTPALGSAVYIPSSGTAAPWSPGAQSASSHGAPFSPGYGAGSASSHGALSTSSHGTPSSTSHGAPYSTSHGIPSSTSYGTPSSGHGTPSSTSHGTPSTTSYGAPSAGSHSVPSPGSHGKPSVGGHDTSSVPSYASSGTRNGAPSAPTHGASYGVPSSANYGAPSGPNYGASAGTSHGAPSAAGHGAPSDHNHGLPIGAHIANTGTPGALAAKKDVVKAVTYEWAPPGIDQSLALRYMELLPPERRPIAGTQGADYRKKQMAKQLPEHDQDPARCHELSPAEVKQMQQYVRKYKDEALGIGDLALPGELAAHTGPQISGTEAKSAPGTGPAPGEKGIASIGKAGTPGVPGAVGSSGPAGNYACYQCQRAMKTGDPAVYAERAGYDKLWHPACFVCCTCNELLVDMIYFWKKGKLYCGRHYGDSEKPRCGGCDELIFSNEYTQAEGQNWHLKHFCCFDCDCVLAGETYVMENDKPVCKPCYMKIHAVLCSACRKPIEPEAQRLSYGEHHWHAEPECFRCGGCTKCLVGQRFMVLQGKPICSVECKKKVMAA